MSLTVDSEELNINYTGFTERKIKVIKETFVLFQHVKITEKEPRKDYTVFLGGEMFGKPGYGYWLSNAKDNYLHVQMVKIRESDGYNGCCLFGFYMNMDKKDFIAYHTDQSYGDDDEI